MAKQVPAGAQDDFLTQELGKHPCAARFQGIGISNLRVMKEMRHVKIALERGESLDDQCLVAGFMGDPPKNYSPPAHYRGVRVFYEYNRRQIRAQ